MGYVLGAGGSVVITEALLPPGDGRAQVQAARVRPAQRADWREGGRGRRWHPPAPPAPRSHVHTASQLCFRADQLSWASASLLPHLLMPRF